MKYLLILLMICGVAYAQEPPYTPMKGNYRFKGIKVDSLFLIPSFADTTAANATYLDSVAGAFIRTGNDFWMRNAELTSWLQNVNIGSGSSPVGLSLQNVLDNNHDLVDNNNFQGTGAGVGSSGRSGIIAIGGDAGSNVVGDNNNYIGNTAGANNIGSYNIGIGGATLSGNSYDISYGIAIGENALRTTSQNNIVLDIVAIGNYAGKDILSGSYIVAIGTEAFNGGSGEQINAIGNNAAQENSGNYVNAIGLAAAGYNTGNNVNGLGLSAAAGGHGDNLNALGYSTAINNTGDNVNALGQNAADSNTASDVNALGFNAGYHNAGVHLNAFGNDAGNANLGNQVNAFGPGAGNGNSGGEVNAFGANAGQNNTYSHVTLLGNSATATANNQLVLSDGNFNTRINYEIQDSSKEYSIPKNVQGEFSLTNYYEVELNVDYYAYYPGMYFCASTGGDFYLPSPYYMQGQRITVYNKTGASFDFAANIPQLLGTGAYTTIPDNTIIDMISANNDWIILSVQP